MLDHDYEQFLKNSTIWKGYYGDYIIPDYF